MAKGSYHHGDLRRAILSAAVEAIDENGAAALSLRDVARRAGVSHSGPAHHFRDKAGVLTALAAAGFRMLARELETSETLVEAGVAYVRFAVGHRAHFDVMFRPDLHHPDSAELKVAQLAAGAVLASAVREVSADRLAPVAAWSLVHGFATLALTGTLGPDVTEDLDASARAVAEMLFPPGSAR
ncbi:AcrR family transcriptional regulator [Amycolatopsis endophytica]|uniref:AcrR family transcriptional regulator n=1 Tax=Amycolatopsis endophytica TaxID=860233 RepID=A0A853B1M2_9PSEU|nr:TetR/AcrR family transcriptional regulator [Amycolatopsis endophytica]NYI88734.1 AcrR family transcriptional regulator [Amycolatopsis endophytica]